MIKFLENVEVGKYYQVPCIHDETYQSVWLPVLPFKHSDKQFGERVAQKEHYHFDLRFFRKKDFFLFNTFTADLTRMTHVQTNFDGELVFIKRRCIRLESGLMSPYAPDYPNLNGLTKKTIEWYKNQIGKPCLGRICPHLNQPMLERDGVLECSYHGLIADKETEIIIGNIHGITND